MSTTTDEFFAEQKEKSKVKSLIVSDFFSRYLPIITNSVGVNKTVYYIDLFAGPGYFNNGEKSTPILIMDILDKYETSKIPDVRLILNDQNVGYYRKLSVSVIGHPAYGKLAVKPEIYNRSASQIDLNRYIQKGVPVFSFIDPWGYVDVSYEQLWTLVKNVGSDNILFFNTNRISEDMGKSPSEKHMNNLFGMEFHNAQTICTAGCHQKVKMEKLLVCFSKNLYQVAKEKSTKIDFFILPFSFESEQKELVSHYIIFITKNHRAISEMKKVMLKHNNSTNGKFGFDAKDVDKLTFFRREDDVSLLANAIIKDMFTNYRQLLDIAWDLESLLKAMDRYYMLHQYVVTPVALSELKEIIQKLYEKGYIELTHTAGKKRFTNRVTNSGKFKMKTEVLEIL